MPKKFKGENSKAVEAKIRQNAAKQAEAEQAEKDKEDALWEDNDKHMARKQQRKDEKEKKRQELVDRKKTLQQLHEEEMDGIKGAKSQAARLTRAQIIENQEKAAAAAEASKAREKLSHDEVPLEENVNLIEKEDEEARTVEEAISMLSVGSELPAERHPEKRMRAAFAEYEESRLPSLKAENPNMRLSQLKQMMKKEWMKSPLNPMNQRIEAYNTKN